MKNLILLLSILAGVFSCRQPDKVKSKEFGVEIKTGGIPGNTSFEAFLYNTDITTYAERYRINKTHLDKNTLYVLKHDYQDTIEVTDSIKVKLSDSAVDSLYELTYGYLSTVDMNNVIEDKNEVRELVTDGARLSVSLLYNNKRLQCSEWNLKGISRASKQAGNLFDFLDQKLPEKFHLY